MTVDQVEAAAGGQEWGEQVPDTNSDTAGSGGVDTAGTPLTAAQQRKPTFSELRWQHDSASSARIRTFATAAPLLVRQVSRGLLNH